MSQLDTYWTFPKSDASGTPCAGPQSVTAALAVLQKVREQPNQCAPHANARLCSLSEGPLQGLLVEALHPKFMQRCIRKKHSLVTEYATVMTFFYSGKFHVDM